MRVMRYILLALPALLGIQVGQANAETIHSLFNTGVDANGQVLSATTDLATGIGDPHYSLVSVPGGTTATEVFNFNQWLAIGSNPVSAWIAPNEETSPYYLHGQAGPAGAYDYRTTFDLTGLNPLTASISGQWAADNQGTDILINGHSTNQQTLRFGTGEGFVSFASFSITNNFVAGMNTLDFLVTNLPGPGDNPTGLRVQFLDATAQPSITATPAPSTLVMSSILLGMFGAVWSLKRLKLITAAA